MEPRITPAIPSELLAPLVVASLMDWLKQLGRGDLTFEQLKERMKAIWWVLMKNNGHFALVAWNNHTRDIDEAHRTGKLEQVCKAVLAF